MNLNEILNKIEPEACDHCGDTGYEYFEDKNADNYKDCLIACDECNGTGYKHTVDELVMDVIGLLANGYDTMKMGHEVPIWEFTNAFIKIVQICKMVDTEIIGLGDWVNYSHANDSAEERFKRIIELMTDDKYIELYNHALKALYKLCDHHKIDILKHVEGRLK